jgi:choline transport protein
VASGGFLAAGLVQGLVLLNNVDYTPKPWQAVLLFYASIFFALFVNTVVSRALPKIEGLILVFHVLGFFAILVPLVYIGTQGLSFMVGLVGPVFCLLGRLLFYASSSKTVSNT